MFWIKRQFNTDLEYGHWTRDAAENFDTQSGTLVHFLSKLTSSTPEFDFMCFIISLAVTHVLCDKVRTCTNRQKEKNKRKNKIIKRKKE